MSMVAGLAMVVAFGIAIGGALLLYVLVRAEHDDRRVMDRDEAEKVARKDRENGGQS